MTEEQQKVVFEFWNSNAEICGNSARRMIEQDGILMDVVDSVFPNARKLDVLDVGSGGGYSSITLSLHKHRVTSIDICPRMLEAAEHNAEAHNTKVEYILDDIQRSRLPDSSFDLVLFYETLFTVVDISLAIAETVRLLRPGGRILIMDGNYFQDQKIDRYRARKEYFKMKYGVFEMQALPEFADLDYDALENCVKPLYVSRVIHPGWEVWNFLDMGLEDLRIDTMDTENYVRVTPTGKASVALSYMISARKPFGIPGCPRNFDDRMLDLTADDPAFDGTVSERVFSVLSNRTRIIILQLLLASPLNVRRLSELIGESQALTSYNLRLLRDCGIIGQKRCGRETTYFIINPPVLRSFLNMSRYIGGDEESISAGRRDPL